MMTLPWLIAFALVALAFIVSAVAIWWNDGLSEWRMIALSGVPGVALLTSVALEATGGMA